MKRFLVLFLILGLVVGSVATAEAGKKKKKKTPPPYTMEVTYTQPAVGTAGAGVTFEALSFPTNETHVFMDLEITDNVSPMAHGSFSWDTDGDPLGAADTGITVCGSTPEPVSVPTNTEIIGFMWLLPGPDCPMGFSTGGTIKATFSVTP